MAEPNLQDKLSGTIEADETYVGGKPRYRGKSKRGRVTKKSPVLALVKRNNNVRAKVIPNVTGKTLAKEIIKNVDLCSRLMKDQLQTYKKLARNSQVDSLQ